MQRKLISLPSLSDLEREASCTGQEAKFVQSRAAYAGAQVAIERAHQQMAWAALAIVRPEDFQRINQERRMKVQDANREAREAARGFFTEECVGFVSDDPPLNRF